MKFKRVLAWVVVSPLILVAAPLLAIMAIYAVMCWAIEELWGSHE